MEIHIARGEEQYGPFSPDEVRRQLADGSLLPNDLAWAEGAIEWVPLSSLPQLALAPAAAKPVEVRSPEALSPVPVVTSDGLAPASGAAVTSMVCGILSLTLLPGVAGLVAIICGHLARGGIRRAQGTLRGESMAIAGLVMGYLNIVFVLLAAVAVVFMFIFGGIALPFFSDLQLRGKETASLSNAKQLAIGCHAYAADHHGAFPKSLEELVPKYVAGSGNLACPLSPGVPVGYDYFGGADLDPADKVLLMSKFVDPTGKRIIAHVDGSCVIAVPPILAVPAGRH